MYKYIIQLVKRIIEIKVNFILRFENEILTYKNHEIKLSVRNL